MLLKVVPSAIPIHVSIAVDIAPAMYKAIDKLQRTFIWTGSVSVSSGRCLVAWPRVPGLVEHGGLGVLYLATLGYALRLRWTCLESTEPGRLWVSLPCKHDKIIQAMFHTSVTVQVGNRSRTLFWTERWLDDMAISTLAPDLIEAVHKKVRKNRLAVEALPNAAWIHDIMGSLSVRVLRQYVNLWSWLSDQRLPDKFVWKWTSNQQYFVSSAYRAFFIGQCGLLSARELRKTTAPPTCKFFVWIALLGHYWIGDRLLRHNLNDDDTCALCTQASKSIHHLLLSCVFSREVWFRTLRSAGISSCTPSTSSTMPD
jgi:hypothetical protein